MSGIIIDFRFESTDDETRFVREYLPDAWERFEASDFFETGWFWPYAAFAEYESVPDDGFLQLNFEGDPDLLVKAEAPRWNDFDGLSDWTVKRPEEETPDSLLAQQRENKGEIAGEWDYRLKPLVTQFILEYVQEFPESLPLLNVETTSGDTIRYGYWVVIHYAMIQAGYNWYDETDACLRSMQNRLKSIAHYRGADPAREEYKRLLMEWKSHREDLERWLEETTTGEGEIE